MREKSVVLRSAVAATAIVPMAFVAACAVPSHPTGGTSAASANAKQALPVIDAGYLYSQLYDMSENYVYRASGLDGPPQNPHSSANLPATVNGWQEFYQHWKGQMTSPAVMGSLAPYLSVRDHYFRVRFSPGGAGYFGITKMPYDSDVAEVTIPGATCPGQRVLLAGHPDSTPPAGGLVPKLIDQGKFQEAMQVLYSSNLGNGSAYDDTSGVTMGMAEFQALLHWWQANGTWPTRTLKIGLFDAEETGLNGSFFYASQLIPKGPQGQYVLVANMDQNGMEYPAYHWGTDHYLNNLTGGGVGPWYTNINASPLKPNPIYPPGSAAWKAIQANLPAIKTFRTNLESSVMQAFSVLGAKYHHRLPLENPLLIASPGAINPTTSVTAYTATDQRRYSPVQDDSLGRTDQVPFVAQGIPGYGVLGAYDSNATENPYPARYKDKPVIGQYAGYDTLRDHIQELNLYASGTPHGPGGLNTPSVGLTRALELPATWTAYLAMRPAYAGAVPRPDGPVAYFETTPVQPTTTTVTFDGSFSADAGRSGHLTYVWDFGDGTYGLGPRVTHTYSAAQWADAKLIVIDGRGRVSTYRQAVDVAAAAGAAPTTNACGTLPIAQGRQIIKAAEQAKVSGQHFATSGPPVTPQVPLVTAKMIQTIRP